MATLEIPSVAERPTFLPHEIKLLTVLTDGKPHTVREIWDAFPGIQYKSLKVFIANVKLKLAQVGDVTILRLPEFQCIDGKTTYRLVEFKAIPLSKLNRLCSELTS